MLPAFDLTTKSEIIMSLQTNTLDILVKDRFFISYRPELRAITGSVTATILLQQVLYRWDNNNREPFYKFRVPCDHALCRDGDTWTQELGFSVFEFDNALKKIGFKRTGKNKDAENTDKPIEYWTDLNRVTWYTIIPEILEPLFNKVYGTDIGSGTTTDTGKSEKGSNDNGVPTEFTKMQKVNLPVNAESEFTTIITENTAKNDNVLPPKSTPAPAPSQKQQQQSSFLSHESKQPPPTPATVTDQKQPEQPLTENDIEMVAVLLSLLPEPYRKPSLKILIERSLKQHGETYVKGAILYALDHSNGGTWQKFKAYLDKTLHNHEWFDGYLESRDTGTDSPQKAQLFLESRRSMPVDLLKLDAQKGCQVSQQVLREKGIYNM